MTHMDVSDQSTSKVPLNKHFTSCSFSNVVPWRQHPELAGDSGYLTHWGS